MRRATVGVAVALMLAMGASARAEPELLSPAGPPLPGTAELTIPGDLASNLVAGVDRFLQAQLDGSRDARDRRWRAGAATRSGEDWQRLVRTNRTRLAEILGAVETRSAGVGLEWVGGLAQSPVVATSTWARVEAVRWAAFGEVHGEGLLVTPTRADIVADVVVVPDADVTPEQWVGLDALEEGEVAWARGLAARGCRVLVPFLINRRKGEPKVDWDPQRGRNLGNREYLHRAAFEMGRTLAGYEVMKILAAVDALSADAPARPVGVAGWGEGGRLALYAAALDLRLRAVWVSGYFGGREDVWQEPLDRNLFGQLERLGDAEIALLVEPRPLVIEAARGPELVLASDGGAPGRLVSPDLGQVRAEVARAGSLGAGAGRSPWITLVETPGGGGPGGSVSALNAWLGALVVAEGARSAPRSGTEPDPGDWVDLRRVADPRGRSDRQRGELDRHTQQLLTDSGAARQRFMKDLDPSSPEKFAASQARYREFFAERVIGRFDLPLQPARPRSREAYDDPKWRGYEVVLDVYPDVIAYGLLLLPKDLKPGERRPVVVCQHGLEGRPQDTIGKAGYEAYGAFAARLAELGFITFAPQNPYLFRDSFRVLQRKANPLGKTLFSVIVPQHQQLVDWLRTQPFVDPERVAFYGLSYGGKTAMRVPALVTDYCLSICSADFNEWVWKNASTRSPYSYVWTGEYEIFEWNLGHTFNYAEMAALIAPRPFMVERGHFDGVAPDETVAYEFAKVRHLYAARLKLPPAACQIEWFVGPHTIHGAGTYDFLRRHLGASAAVGGGGR